jgi:hypothetical protein
VTLLEEKSKIINQGTYAWHNSSTKAQSGRIPFLGGNKKREPFLGTLAPALTKAGGKQKGTNKNLLKNFALSGKTPNFIPASSIYVIETACPPRPGGSKKQPQSPDQQPWF